MNTDMRLELSTLSVFLFVRNDFFHPFALGDFYLKGYRTAGAVEFGSVLKALQQTWLHWLD